MNEEDTMEEGLWRVREEIRAARENVTSQLSRCLEQWSGRLAGEEWARSDRKLVDLAVVLSSVRDSLIKAERRLEEGEEDQESGEGAGEGEGFAEEGDQG
jgi:hypothetical protein